MRRLVITKELTKFQRVDLPIYDKYSTITIGLIDKFGPKRIYDTPITEMGMLKLFLF